MIGLNAILFNKNFKNIAYKILKGRLPLTPFYQFFYQKVIDKKIAQRSKKPNRVSIENTNICPANCSFCSHETMKRKQGVMDMSLFKKIVDNVVDWGLEGISITGFGEPLLDPHFFERVTYAKKKGVKWVSVNTNSRFITDEKAMKLLNSGIDEVYVSCNQLGEDNVKKFCYLKHMSKAKMPLIYLSGMRGEFEPKKYKGADGVSISFLHNWAGNINKQFKPALRDPCRFLWHMINVDWTGKATLCCVDYESQCVIGDLNNQSLQDVWFSKKSSEYKRYHKDKDFGKISICSKCTYNYHHKSPWWA